ncbi:type IV toxin-antitoxin system AbiEi family antitoxin domain-containing protein [Paraburkholderia sp. 32]|uniref:type IV toxin-antitoxin system AbiEi family antitoxin domain-containing protein n=1 Tax=Paraburkholderia sp. 32 TaxID=2991057 RepID=UPI003D216930
MANTTIQRFLEKAPRGQPLDPEMLRALAIGASQTSYLVRAGWLKRLSKGAYLLVGDQLSTDGVIAYLSRRVPGLHVGGKAALDWQGIRHNIAFRPRIALWAFRSYRFPDWVREHMPFSFQTTQLFRDDAPIMDWLRPLPNKNKEILVSIPELALLELASDIGKEGWKGQTLEEAMHIADLMRNLRVDVLTSILGYCVRVKVLKLVRDLGQSSGHSWCNDLQAYVEKRSPGKRWSRSGKNVRRLTLKP